MATSKSKKALREHRKANGLCLHCGALAIYTQTRCEACRDRDKALRKNYTARDEALGICKNIGCSFTVKDGKKYCTTCNQKSANRTKKRREGWYAQGLCYYCGLTQHLPGLVRCEECNKKCNATIKRMCDKRVAKGVCAACGKNPLEPDYRQCTNCIAKGKLRHAKLKEEIINAYGGPLCVGCGEKDIRILQIDHINGGGSQHAKQIGGRGRVYKDLKDRGFPPGFRVLCPSCNIRAYRKIPFPNDIYLG